MATFWDQFWRHVQRTDGCWEWQGKLDDIGGYGKKAQPRCGGAKQKQVLTHRASWEMFFGPIPDGLLVCHSCDNPPCVRPDHLFLGTDADNQRDKVAKLRSAYGERNGRVKITVEDAKVIRSMYATGLWSQPRLGRHFGVGHSQIGRIVRGEHWTRA